jgi:hypothetical protein
MKRCKHCGTTLPGRRKRGWRIGQHPLYRLSMYGWPVRAGTCPGEPS